jgi:TonB family protein
MLRLAPARLAGWSVGALLGLAAALPSDAAGAQVSAPVEGDAPAHCAPESLPRADTAVFTLYLGAPRADTGRAAEYAPLAHTVAMAFAPPSRVSLVTWPGTSYDADDDPPPSPDAITDVGPLTGEVRFRLRKGRVRDLKWRLLPDSREVARAVQEAIGRADSLQHLLGLRAPTDSEGYVRLGVSMTRGVAPPGAMPLMRVRMPYVRVDSPVTVLEMARPAYPRAALQRRVEDDVTLQYVVDEDGRARRASIRVIEASYSDFVEAAADAITASRFRPAQAGACPVKLQVQQRIRFQTD